jgi:hypothetical protein
MPRKDGSKPTANWNAGGARYLEPVSLTARQRARAAELCADPAFAGSLQGLAAVLRAAARRETDSRPADHRATLADLEARLREFAWAIRRLGAHPLRFDMEEAARERLGEELPSAWPAALEAELEQLQQIIHVTDQHLGPAPSGPSAAKAARKTAAAQWILPVLQRYGIRATRTPGGAWARALGIVLEAAGDPVEHPERYLPRKVRASPPSKR